ncbi:MAG TPA: DUF3887 domain-containing protein [Rhodanobacteraceae bacterium]|nr:DUF3887 domain-containing protein [Rhodanobacteraceae bacterium]
MHRKPIVLALGAALPVLALAAGQPPASSAQPHPASSAHANAVAGQANAIRIEACGNQSASLLEALGKGDYKAATSDFDKQMKAGLDAARLGAFWASVGQQFGKLESRGDPQSVMYEGMSVVSISLHFTKGDLSAQVACDSAGKIAGFHVRPATPASSQ